METNSVRGGQDVSGLSPLSYARLQCNTEDSNIGTIAQVDRGMLNRVRAKLDYCWDSCRFVKEHT
jgi:hypothetical protein